MRSRGRAELARDLERKGFERGAVAEALDRLLRERWMDDAAAARSLVRAKGARYGRRRLELELAARGFSAETAAEALASLDAGTEEATLRRAFEKAWRQARELPARERRARVARTLARKGFAPHAVSAMMRDSHEID